MGKIVFASNGEHGLRMAQESSPDLVLLDIELPDIIGPVVYKQIREYSQVPVIFVTSHRGLPHQIAAMESGASDFISKPFDPETIRSSIQKQLEKNLQEVVNEQERDRISQTYNRTYFDQKLPQLWEQHQSSGAPLALALLKIDHYQEYCESFGSLKADACVKKIGGALGEQFQSGNVVLARIGVNEFALLRSIQEQDSLEDLGHQMVQCVSNLAIPHAFTPNHPFLSASVGICSTIPKFGHTSVAFLAQAEKALSQAQNGGYNRFAALRCK